MVRPSGTGNRTARPASDRRKRLRELVAELSERCTECILALDRLHVALSQFLSGVRRKPLNQGVASIIAPATTAPALPPFLDSAALAIGHQLMSVPTRVLLWVAR